MGKCFCIRSALKILISRSELKGKVKVILVVSPAGAGKSKFVKLITGVDRLVGHQLSTGKFSFSGVDISI
jgi:ABC-type ATPase involved in cell division